MGLSQNREERQKEGSVPQNPEGRSHALRNEMPRKYSKP